MPSDPSSHRRDLEADYASPPVPDAVRPRLCLAKWLYGNRASRPGMEDRLFGEPAWDMLLDLYVHQARGTATSVTSVCLASHTPMTTALRYIDLLYELGWVERLPDASDKRRSFLALTPMGRERLERYFDRMLERLWRMVPELLPSGGLDEAMIRRRRA